MRFTWKGKRYLVDMKGLLGYLYELFCIGGIIIMACMIPILPFCA